VLKNSEISHIQSAVKNRAVKDDSTLNITIEKSGIYLVVTNNNGRIVNKKVTIF
jgi:hypothetical protein